ncbi:MAG TPA: hypothetical protein VIJ72_03660 [Rhizomicrobium sp.]
MKRLTSALVTTLVLAAPAAAITVPACQFPNGVHNAVALDEFPRPIRSALHRHLPDLVDPGQPFNASAIMTGSESQRRLVRGFRHGARWVIGYEHGGRHYNDVMLVFSLPKRAHTADLLTIGTTTPRALCAKMLALAKGGAVPRNGRGWSGHYW